MQNSLQNSNEVYRSAFSRQKNLIQSPKEEGEFETVGRLVIGLGGENVLETGITLHHTYGTPIIPGTALKGLASHYCDRAWGWGAKKQGFKRDEAYHKTIFGSTADSADKDSGHIVFHDAWITPNSLVDSLQTDVMTSHHSDYYSGKTLPTGELAAPTDFDSPNPITFLSIVGTFHIVVSCDVAGEMDKTENKVEGQKWAELTFDLLTDALKDWGIGGKTNAGYGRLEKIDSSTKPVQNTQSTSSSIGPDWPDAKTTPAAPIGLGPRHEKGEIVDAKRTEDPKNRGRIWFKADDGFGGIVMFGKPPNIDIGKTARLEISGKMNEGYNFAVPGSREEHESQKRRDTRRRR
ncbi:CRISPR system Cmr subunit Cmr6 [uncultured archaeon]|nr:CRISPR system Cmr subunit Cmr6 [uncultured archaeon]